MLKTFLNKVEVEILWDCDRYGDIDFENIEITRVKDGVEIDYDEVSEEQFADIEVLIKADYMEEMVDAVARTLG